MPQRPKPLRLGHIACRDERPPSEKGVDADLCRRNCSERNLTGAQSLHDVQSDPAHHRVPSRSEWCRKRHNRSPQDASEEDADVGYECSRLVLCRSSVDEFKYALDRVEEGNLGVQGAMRSQRYIAC